MSKTQAMLRELAVGRMDTIMRIVRAANAELQLVAFEIGSADAMPPGKPVALVRTDLGHVLCWHAPRVWALASDIALLHLVHAELQRENGELPMGKVGRA